MNRLLVILSAIMLTAAPAMAQNTQKRETLGKKISKTWRKATKGVTDATQKLGKELGIGTGAGLGEVKVNGTYYMNIYMTNVYHGSDGTKLRDEAASRFARRYPKAKILSCAIPQTDWATEEVEQNGNIVGYLQTMYCYVLAQDGEDGYINAKFTYEQYRKVGEALHPVQNKWPEWTNTDIIPEKDYWELVTK